MIQFEFLDGVGIIRLDREEKYHAFIREMALQLQDILDKCDNDSKVRTILITAKGKAFCAGQDLSEATDPKGPDLSQIVQEHYNPIIRKIRAIDKPIVAAVNGVAAGAGVSIALACDIVVAAESAVFVQAFSKIGLIPDSGGTFFLPRIVGMQRAAGLMMTADSISAEEAEKMGMIYKVYSDNSFEEESLNFASKLAKMPTKGLALTKKLLNASYSNSLEEQLDMEDKYQNIASKTYDFNEGINAFFEKREPNFKGK